MKNKYYLLLFLIMVSNFFYNCGNAKLSENQARDIISQEYPKKVSGFIDLIYAADVFTLNREKVFDKQSYLEEAGLIFQNNGSGRFMDAYRAGFTDKAKSFMIGKPESLGAYSDKKRAFFNIGEIRFYEITGIFQEGTPGVADVEYEVHFESNGFPAKCNTKEYGELAGGEKIKLKVKLKKYDNGWKISE